MADDYGLKEETIQKHFKDWWLATLDPERIEQKRRLAARQLRMEQRRLDTGL